MTPLLRILFVVALGALPAPAVTKPNVILILADDMAVGDLGCMNGGRSRTPNLDRLKEQSTWFSRAYSASPVCAPARAALLTGRYPHRTGVVTLNSERYPALTRLKRDEFTLGHLFRAGGYDTGLVGKWHCGTGKGYHPLDRGFDEFEGFSTHLQVPSYSDYRLDVNRKEQAIQDRYLTTDLTERALGFIRRHRNRPFFLHLAHYAPHRPLGAPADRIAPYVDAGVDRETATVYAMIEIMDEGIGELIAELDKLKIRRNTIVVFASDNGPDPLVAERFNADLRGTKYMVNEGGIRVPFMIHWAGRFPPSERGLVVHFTDVVPTLLELCELKKPEGLELDGASLLPLLKGDYSGLGLPERRFWQWNRGNPRYSHNAAVREHNWKLVRPFVTRNLPKGKSEEALALYDLATDPGETTNLLFKNPETGMRLAEALDKWCREVETDRRR